MEEFDPYYRWLGIGSEEQPANHYRLLGLRIFENNPDVIAEAADRQMSHLRTHQLGAHGALSQRLLNEISTARVCLLNPAKKAAYDATLAATPAGATKDARQVAAGATAIPPAPKLPPVTRVQAVPVGTGTNPARAEVAYDASTDLGIPRKPSRVKQRAKKTPVSTWLAATVAVGLCLIVAVTLALKSRGTGPAAASTPRRASPAASADKRQHATTAAATPRVEAPATSPKWIDLVSLVDLDRDTLAGKWDRVGAELTCKAGGSLLMVPLAIDGSYTLEAELTQLGNDTIIVVLPVGQTNCALYLHGYHGALSELGFANGQPLARKQPGNLPKDQRFNLKVDVETTDGRANIDVLLDAQPYLSARAVVDSLKYNDKRITHPSAPAFGGSQNTVFVLHSARLKMNSGSARPLTSEGAKKD